MIRFVEVEHCKGWGISRKSLCLKRNMIWCVGESQGVWEGLSTHKCSQNEAGHRIHTVGCNIRFCNRVLSWVLMLDSFEAVPQNCAFLIYVCIYIHPWV